ncbi:MAG: arsenate reductase ArsC [Deltaproteobacteria bacterium]|nr:arsenate reductase ArsC [Deltaproteobacteria bacterium]MCB9487411.1 arsenate reductase ArsC [Deltaproteobacteria bacterium]
MPTPKRILFLCTRNRCRSQMAEALIRHDFGDKVEVHSAGTQPATPHPLALRVLSEIGVDHTGARSKNMEEFDGQTFDAVATLCDSANETCPVFIGGTQRAHLGFDDPDAASGTEEEILAVFRRVRDEIRERVGAWVREEVLGGDSSTFQSRAR